MKKIRFVGSALTTLSSKNQLCFLKLVTKSERKSLPKVITPLIICKSQFGPYLDYYTKPEWERLETVQPGFTIERDNPLHTTLSGRGIITLTDELVAYANLTTAQNQVVITGNINSGEIMNKAYYDEFIPNYEEALAIIDELHGTNNLEEYLKREQRRR